MTFEEFLYFVPDKCEYETIYIDNEGRLILVVNMVDAYSMVNKMVRVEREAIADMVEPWLLPEYVKKIRNRGQA